MPFPASTLQDSPLTKSGHSYNSCHMRFADINKFNFLGQMVANDVENVIILLQWPHVKAYNLSKLISLSSFPLSDSVKIKEITKVEKEFIMFMNNKPERNVQEILVLYFLKHKNSHSNYCTWSGLAMASQRGLAQ